MLKAIKRFFSILNYSNVANKKKLEKRSDAIFNDLKNFVEVNNKVVTDFRKARVSILTGSLALLGFIIGYSHNPLITRSISSFLGFILFGILSLLIDYQYDINHVERAMKYIQDHQKENTEMKAKIQEFEFGKEEALEFNEKIKNYAVPKNRYFLLLKNIIYFTSLACFILGILQLISGYLFGY